MGMSLAAANFCVLCPCKTMPEISFYTVAAVLVSKHKNVGLELFDEQ
jgi:hypothetical protein